MYYHYRRGSTIPKLFDQICDKYGDKTAAIHVDTGKSLTFKQLKNFTDRTANFFKSEGFQQGDVVAIFMLNCPE